MIVYLAWGSLVWEPGDLPLTDDWRGDGPEVRVEFVRQSSNKRLTLVLTPSADPLPSLWTCFAGEDVAVAREHLRLREKIPKRNREIHIGSWVPGAPEPECIPGLEGGRERVAPQQSYGPPCRQSSSIESFRSLRWRRRLLIFPAFQEKLEH